MRSSRFRFTIRRIMDVVAIASIVLWSLRFSADTWASIVTSLTLAALGLAVLGARFHRDRVRAFFVGAAISGSAYFFFFVSPTFARVAAKPYQRITQSLITIPIAAAGGSAAGLCYWHYGKSITGQYGDRFGESREHSSQTVPPPE
jgi:hypothetical protein